MELCFYGVFILTPTHGWHWRKLCPWKCQCLLSAINCFAAKIRGIRLERGLADVMNGSCPKEKKRNKLLLPKPISSQAQAGFPWFPEIHRNRAEKTIWTYVFMPRTLPPEENVAHNPTNPFIKTSSACWDFYSASSVGMLLAVQDLCSFQETHNTCLGSSFLQTWAIVVVEKDEEHKPFLRKLQHV